MTTIEVNTTEVPAAKVAVKVAKAKKPEISFAGVRWDRMTDKEVAEQVFNDPRNVGAIRTKSLKNFAVTVFLKRKKLASSGRNVAFGGRVVNGVKKQKYVHAKSTKVSTAPEAQS